MIRGRIHSIGGPTVMLREFAPVMKAVLQEVVEIWHRRYLPRHFQTGAVAQYNYQKRSRDYMRRKARRKGHQMPLVYGGDLKRQVTRSARIMGSRRRAVASMSGPSYLYRYRKDSRQPDMADELTRVTANEERQLAVLIERKATRKLNELRTQEVVT